MSQLLTNATGADVISDLELEHILNSLQPSDLENVGVSKAWVQQMSMYEELNVQAVLEASEYQSGKVERVRDCLVENEKLALVVHEVLLLEIWKDEILPRILQIYEAKSIFQVYMILFNQANLVNLLETILFHSSACSSLEDSALDLTDFCVRHLYKLFNEDDPAQDECDEVIALENYKQQELPDDNPRIELQRHIRTTSFQIGMKSLSILRYLTDNLEDVVLGVSSRMTITHDIPGLLVKCLEEKPWIKKSRASPAVLVFEGSDWKELTDESKIQQMEGQVWIALYNILSKPESAQKYEINEFRKSVLLKLLRFLNEPVENQLPFLGSLKKWLLQLQLGKEAIPETKNSLLIESMAVLRQELLKKYQGQYDRIASIQAPLLLEQKNDKMYDEEISKLIETFDKESVQKLISGAEKSRCEAASGARSKSCANCKVESAKNRCSRCHSVRYCGRDCQVKHWFKHKNECKVNDKRTDKIVELN